MQPISGLLLTSASSRKTAVSSAGKSRSKAGIFRNFSARRR
jgi:hypothetical protein